MSTEVKHEHIVPVHVYVLVFVALEILATATALLAHLDLGAFNAVIAFAIAVTKMLLVVLFFMHARYSERIIHAVCAVAVFWFGIMVVLTESDYLTRWWHTR